MLQWLTFSALPLHHEELAEVVAVDAKKSPYFDSDQRLLDPHDILTMCGSLVTLGEVFPKSSQEFDTDETTRIFDERSVNTEVRLAHFSVQEYLISERNRLGPAKFYIIRETDSNEAIAEQCLACVLHANLYSKVLSQSLENSHWFSMQPDSGPVMLEWPSMMRLVQSLNLAWVFPCGQSSLHSSY